jgi:DNA-binding MarR family transcriptional regulator
MQRSDYSHGRMLPRGVVVPYDPTMASKERVAREAWKAMFDFIIATSAERNAVIGRAGLTPNDARTLSTIALAGKGRSMRSLADEWRCDASTVTWIVDRLEARGLAERRPHPTDRRSRLIALTAGGAKLWAEIQKASYQPPKGLLELSEGDLRALRDAVKKLPGGVPAQG